MPTEARLGGVPRKNVGGIHNDAEKKAAASTEDQPKNPKEAKKVAEDADRMAGNVPVVESAYEQGSPTEDVPAGRTSERRPVTRPEPGPGQTPKTEVEMRKLHEQLNRPDAQSGQGPGDHDQEYQAYYFSDAETAIRAFEAALAAFDQSNRRDPADVTFNPANIPPQATVDAVEGVRDAVKAMRKAVTKGNWVSPEEQHAKINPQDRYDRNIVE